MNEENIDAIIFGQQQEENNDRIINVNNEDIKNSVIKNDDKMIPILKSIIKHKIVFEMLCQKYEQKEKYLMLVNMISNTANSFILSMVGTSILINEKESINIVSTSLTFFCTIISYVLKMSDYSKKSALYKNYINYCENIIWDYINFKVSSNDDEKNTNIDSIINNYKNIIKFGSSVGEIDISNLVLEDEVLDAMITQFDNISNINSKKIKLEIDKKKRVSIKKDRKFSIFSILKNAQNKK